MQLETPLLPAPHWLTCGPRLQYAYRSPAPVSARQGWFTPHWFSTWLVHAGSVRVGLRDGRSWHAGAGQLLVLPPLEPRYQDITAETDLSSIAITLPLPDGQPLPPLPRLLAAAAAAELVAAIDALVQAYTGESRSRRRVVPAFTLSSWLACQEALMRFVRCWWSQLAAAVVETPVLDRRVSLARQVLARQTRMGPVPYAALSAAVGLGRAQIDRLFAAQLGRSPRAERDQLLLQQVLSDLADPQLGVATVARHYGFHDSSHLCRWFRRHLGTSPERYRRSGLGVLGAADL
ncbi:MAG: helix-turn-helix transcriptional regulator [Planctomycetota bacterium]